MDENEIEKICISRDIKNLKLFTENSIIKNDSVAFNKNGVDIYIIDKGTYEIKSLIDIKPSIEHDYRRQYYFELYTTYPNGKQIPSWGKHTPIHEKQFIAFTDDHRITLFNKNLVYKVLTDLEKNRPNEIKECIDKKGDYRHNKCKKKYCLIGFNRNYDYLLKMKPLIFDIFEGTGKRMDNDDIKRLDDLRMNLFRAMKRNDEDKFMEYFSEIMEDNKISPLEKFQCTLFDEEVKNFLAKHTE